MLRVGHGLVCQRQQRQFHHHREKNNGQAPVAKQPIEEAHNAEQEAADGGPPAEVQRFLEGGPLGSQHLKVFGPQISFQLQGSGFAGLEGEGEAEVRFAGGGGGFEAAQAFLWGLHIEGGDEVLLVHGHKVDRALLGEGGGVRRGHFAVEFTVCVADDGGLVAEGTEEAGFLFAAWGHMAWAFEPQCTALGAFGVIAQLQSQLDVTALCKLKDFDEAKARVFCPKHEAGGGLLNEGVAQFVREVDSPLEGGSPKGWAVFSGTHQLNMGGWLKGFAEQFFIAVEQAKGFLFSFSFAFELGREQACALGCQQQVGGGCFHFYFSGRQVTGRGGVQGRGLLGWGGGRLGGKRHRWGIGLRQRWGLGCEEIGPSENQQH